MVVKSPKLSVKFRSYIFLLYFGVILSIIFPPESPKRARWVGGVRCLGQSPKKCGFFYVPSPYDLVDRGLSVPNISKMIVRTCTALSLTFIYVCYNLK